MQRDFELNTCQGLTPLLVRSFLCHRLLRRRLNETMMDREETSHLGDPNVLSGDS